MATSPAATLCRHSPHRPRSPREAFSQWPTILFRYNSLPHPPTPASVAFQIDGTPQEKESTRSPGAPELGTANTTVLATDMWAGAGQKQPRRSEICCTPPEKLHFKNRNSCSNVTCLEKAKHPLPLGSVIACGVCCQAPSTPACTAAASQPVQFRRSSSAEHLVADSLPTLTVKNSLIQEPNLVRPR